MVIDSSAALAILRGEPEDRAFADLISFDRARHMSPVNWFEVAMNVEKYEEKNFPNWERLAQHLGLIVIPVDDRQMRLAHSAWREFGKGRHPAKLNLGDCFAYALAKALNEPLLYKGGDFARTDIKSAL
jgi:ribonuclease VapC